MAVSPRRLNEALHVLDTQETPAVIAPAPVSVEYPNSDTVVIRLPRPSEPSSLQASHAALEHKLLSTWIPDSTICEVSIPLQC